MQKVIAAEAVRAIAGVSEDVTRSVLLCMGRFGPYASLHEVLGVLQEEVVEFNEQVYLKQALRDPAKVEAELIDIAQVAMRAVAEIRLGVLRVGS